MTRPDSEQVDELIRAIRARFVTRGDLTFDFKSGLADVYSRAGLPFERVPASPRRPGPPPQAAAVALACEQLDDFCALLGSIWLSGEQSELPGSQIQQAREVLARLAARLRSGSGPAAKATSAIASAALASATDLLGLADVLLRAQHSRPLDDLLSTCASSPTSHAAVLDHLGREITAALASTRPPVSPRQASVRRSFPARPRRRQAGDR
jgi:hypothetical protein